MKQLIFVALLLVPLTGLVAQEVPAQEVPRVFGALGAMIGMATGGSLGAGLGGGRRAGLGSGVGFFAGGGLGIALVGTKRFIEGRELTVLDFYQFIEGDGSWAFFPFVAGAVLLGAPLGTIIGGGGAKEVALGFVGNIVGSSVGYFVGDGIGRLLSVGFLPQGGGYVAARFEFGRWRNDS
jgi:hypothetical protein